MQRAAGSRSYRGARSFPAPCSAVRPVLQNYALGLELFANAVGGSEVALLLGFGALDDPRLYIACVTRALEPFLHRGLKQPEQVRAGLERCALQCRQS